MGYLREITNQVMDCLQLNSHCGENTAKIWICHEVLATRLCSVDILTEYVLPHAYFGTLLDLFTTKQNCNANECELLMEVSLCVKSETEKKYWIGADVPCFKKYIKALLSEMMPDTCCHRLPIQHHPNLL